MGKGLHLTGCEHDNTIWLETAFVMTDDGHFPEVHKSHRMKLLSFLVPICSGCGHSWNAEALLAPCMAERDLTVKIPEPWQLGETYMYQEPEPVHRWPTPTRWEKITARVRMWYRRAVAAWRQL